LERKKHLMTLLLLLGRKKKLGESDRTPFSFGFLATHPPTLPTWQHLTHSYAVCRIVIKPTWIWEEAITYPQKFLTTQKDTREKRKRCSAFFLFFFFKKNVFGRSRGGFVSF
jgi:hypothetical protein